MQFNAKTIAFSICCGIVSGIICYAADIDTKTVKSSQNSAPKQKTETVKPLVQVIKSSDTLKNSSMVKPLTVAKTMDGNKETAPNASAVQNPPSQAVVKVDSTVGAKPLTEQKSDSALNSSEKAASDVKTIDNKKISGSVSKTDTSKTDTSKTLVVIKSVDTLNKPVVEKPLSAADTLDTEKGKEMVTTDVQSNPPSQTAVKVNSTSGTPTIVPAQIIVKTDSNTTTVPKSTEVKKEAPKDSTKKKL